MGQWCPAEWTHHVYQEGKACQVAICFCGLGPHKCGIVPLSYPYSWMPSGILFSLYRSAIIDELGVHMSGSCTVEIYLFRCINYFTFTFSWKKYQDFFPEKDPATLRKTIRFSSKTRSKLLQKRCSDDNWMRREIIWKLLAPLLAPFPQSSLPAQVKKVCSLLLLPTVALLLAISWGGPKVCSDFWEAFWSSPLHWKSRVNRSQDGRAQKYVGR